MAAPAAALDVAQLEELLVQMWRIRAFETRAMALFEEKLIRGSVHPYIGMEAVAVGACSVLGPGDYITSTHRGHGHCVAKGLDLRRMMAEILGREAGYCRGKGGSMHITAMEHGMLGADAIVAGSSAIAVGAAPTGISPTCFGWCGWGGGPSWYAGSMAGSSGRRRYSEQFDIIATSSSAIRTVRTRS